MSIDFDFLGKRMDEMFCSVNLCLNISSLGDLKQSLIDKGNAINSFVGQFQTLQKGKYTSEFIESLNEIHTNYIELVNNFDDKLMIFIVGNGCTGKSTLLNALIGYEVAKPDELPNTWKIDVYSPSLAENKALIKYTDGHSKTCTVEEAEQIVKTEEIKTKNSKSKYNDQLRIEMANCKTKETREELKKYLSRKFLYKSNISEIRWHVKPNRLLEKCLLVDTPGLNQNLYDLEQLGSIRDYYHKADGILWLLDGSAIAAKNTSNLIDELKTVLHDVGGIRGNIIGVINRMDNVFANGGETAVQQVCQSAKQIFGEYFSQIIPISALQAYNSTKNSDASGVEKSNIKSLENAINDIFLSKADYIKGEAKTQGSTKLLADFEKILHGYKSKANEYLNVYRQKQENYKKFLSDYKNKIDSETSNFFRNYMSEVEVRTERYVDQLAEGKGKSFIENTIYDIDSFKRKYESYLTSKHSELSNQKSILQKSCNISEYKYLKINESIISKSVKDNYSLDLSSLNSIRGFTPTYGDGIFSFLENVFGKIGFWMRKNSIIKDIIRAMKNECITLKNRTTGEFSDILKNIDIACQHELDSSLEQLVFPYNQETKYTQIVKSIETSAVYNEFCDEKMKDFLCLYVK